jgi:dihydropteroate synthase
MINNGAKILDLGARSTAPWSKKIGIDEEIDRIIPAMKVLCKKIPRNIILSIDTQYKEVAEKSYKIARSFDIKIIINDVSCLKSDPSLADFVIENNLPIILMASRKIPGDILLVDDIIMEFQKVIKNFNERGFNNNNIILDPGIGHWIKEKTFQYDLKIINNLSKLRILNKPLLVAISRKSFIAGTLGKYQESPDKRYDGTLSATAIAVYNGAHIIRTHDINQQITDIIKMAKKLRESG